MVSQTNPPEEATRMNTRIRTMIAAVAVCAGFAAATIAPAVSQAQWHTYCVSGHCITHTNYTVGGVSPCTGINSSYNKAYETLLEAIQAKKEQAEQVHPEMTQAEAQAQIEEAEAQVHLASIAAFEWGCDVAAHASPATVAAARASISLSLSLR
jgi:hypothetical protein